MNDCGTCHHDARSHNTGTCNVTAISTREGTTTYPGGCGCTSMPFDMVCATCGKPFVCGQAQVHTQHDCYACYSRKKDDADEASFRPLIEALQRRNIPVEPIDIWNTGGNVMCLALRVTEDREGPYVMWSDDAEYIGFGLYPDTDHTGFFFSPEGEGERSDDSYSWAWGDNAERAATFAAATIPHIVRWLGEQTFTSEVEQHAFGPYTKRTIHYTSAPVVPGAQVEDYDRS